MQPVESQSQSLLPQTAEPKTDARTDNITVQPSGTQVGMVQFLKLFFVLYEYIHVFIKEFTTDQIVSKSKNRRHRDCTIKFRIPPQTLGGKEVRHKTSQK